jgi:hypothetical protein
LAFGGPCAENLACAEDDLEIREVVCSQTEVSDSPLETVSEEAGRGACSCGIEEEGQATTCQRARQLPLSDAGFDLGHVLGYRELSLISNAIHAAEIEQYGAPFFGGKPRAIAPVVATTHEIEDCPRGGSNTH